MDERKILLVEDEDYQRNYLAKALSADGYRVRAVKSGEEALILAKSEHFDVIVTDLIMLGIDGVEFCERLREFNTESGVISISGFSRLFEREKLDRAGFDAHLEKPVRLEALASAIEAALRRKP